MGSGGSFCCVSAEDRSLYSYFIEKQKKVLFVGEGDFSFSVAFAALIIATKEEYKALPNFDAVKVAFIKNSTDWCYGGWTGEEEKWDKTGSFFSKYPRLNKLQSKFCCSQEEIPLLAKRIEPRNGHWKNGYDALRPLNASNSDSPSSVACVPEFSFDAVWF